MGCKGLASLTIFSMDIEVIRSYCMSKAYTSEGFPFDNDTLVFKVMGKMFCLTSLNEPDRINLKCDPEWAIVLREEYPCVIPGFHMNKKMWNTIILDGTVPKDIIMKWIDHSYEQVLKGLPQKLQKEIKGL